MKITLANLHEATAQQVFDQVATHLLTQNKQSMEVMIRPGFGVAKNSCAYRGENDAMCAAGCLIADKEYKPEMEGRAWSDLVADGDAPANHLLLISRLQTVHDMTPPSGWANVLQHNIAQEYKLTLPPIFQTRNEL